MRYLAISILVLCNLSQGAVRVMSYNTAGGARTGISTVFQYVGSVSYNGIAQAPDVVMLQEQTSSSISAITSILNALYGTGTYAQIPLAGTTTGAGLPGAVYNSTTIEHLGTVIVNYPDDNGAARSTLRYQFRPVGNANPDAVFYIYNSHYKASTDSAGRRGVEAAQIRANADALGDGKHILYIGDLNLYSSSEQAWTNLTAAGNGQAFDPVNRVGSWSDNASFKDVHTQSPVVSEHFAGQITGGVDDRFDFQLITGELKDNEGLSYISGSFHTIGNNNTHTMNGNISSGTGAPADVLAALEDVTDHLPTIQDIQSPAQLGATLPEIPAQIDINTSTAITVTIQNTAIVSAIPAADELDYTFTCTGDLTGSGSGTDAPLGGGNDHTIYLDTTTIGPKAGQVIIASSSQGAWPDSLVYNIDYEVIDSGLVVEVQTGWEDFVYPQDPAAVLGTSGDIQYAVSNNNSSQGQQSLKFIGRSGPDGMVYAALLENLLDGDVISCTLSNLNLSEYSNQVTLGAYYLADGQTPYVLGAGAGSNNFAADSAWTQIGRSWIFNSNGGQRTAMLITLSAESQCLFDDLSISIPMRVNATFGQPSQVTCPSYPENDFNQDCRVDLVDFEGFAQYWLDGQTGGPAAGTIDSVIITGVLDGTLSGNTPKALELWVDGTHDLSQYTLEECLDGGNWVTAGTLSGNYTNTFVYVIRTNTDGIAQFNSIFGSSGAFANQIGIADHLYCDNGNDAFRIVKGGVVIDQVYQDSSTQFYRDSFMVRNNSTGPDGGYIAANWAPVTMDILDFKTTAQIAVLVPFGSYTDNPGCTTHSQLDLSGDCQINLADIELFLHDWLQCNLTPGWACW